MFLNWSQIERQQANSFNVVTAKIHTLKLIPDFKFFFFQSILFFYSELSRFAVIKFVKTTETRLSMFNRKIATCVHGLGTDILGWGVELHGASALGEPQSSNPTCLWFVNPPSPLLNLCISSCVKGTFYHQRRQASLGLLLVLASFSLSGLK